MITIEPSTLKGTLRVPSSKSMGHRMMICAALARGKSRITQVNRSKDLLATKKALEALGATFLIREDEWEVEGIDPLKIPSQQINIMCGESGSTLRFMIPIASGLATNVNFYGENQLTSRPIDEYFQTFKENEVHIDYQGKLPLGLTGKYRGGEVFLENTQSSQYISGLLMAAPHLEKGIRIVVAGKLESKAYIDLTIEAMQHFGVSVISTYDEKRELHAYQVKQGECYRPSQVSVEGDYSQAAFWMVAAIMGKMPLTICGLEPQSQQGDGQIVTLLKEMEANLYWEEKNLVVLPSETIGRIIDASQIPDIVPILAVLAARSEGKTTFVNASRLRIKESDRILATLDILNKFGAQAEETEDGLIVYGRRDFVFHAEEKIDSWNDHRIAMAAAIASVCGDIPTVLENAQAVTKSYPHFFDTLVNVGGKVHGQYIW